MKRSVLASILVAAAITSSPGMAADMPVKAPAVVPSWTGLYIGINGGYGWGRAKLVTSPGLPGGLFSLGGNPTRGSADTKLDGGVFGGQIGYNAQSGQWVAGVEADFQWSGIKGDGSGSMPSVFSDPFFGLSDFAVAATEKLEWFGTARFRAGYLVRENLLFYGTLGLAYGKLAASASVTQTYAGTTTSSGGGVTIQCNQGIPCFVGQSSRTAIGLTAGAGFEHRLWSNWSIKAEYLYLLFESHNFQLLATNNLAGTGFMNARHERPDFHIARVGLNWRFGGAGIIGAGN